MNYTEIEIEGMKEILKDKEEEINRLNYIIRHNESREEGWKTYVKKFNDCMKDYKDLVKEYWKLEEENNKLKDERDMLVLQQMWALDHLDLLEKENKNLKERIDILYEFIERNDKLVDEVIDEEDLDKLNRYIYIDDD